MDGLDAASAGHGSDRRQTITAVAWWRHLRWQARSAPGAAWADRDGRHRDQELMHPILVRLERLAGYLALWGAVGVFESAVLTQQGLTWPEALVQVLPPLLVYSF